MSQSAASVRDEFQAFLLRLAGKFEPYPFLRRQEMELRQLSDSMSKPFTLAVFGRMKTGKSSLINALVGKPLAITGVEEATATINWISYGSPAQVGTLLVHWKDGRVEPIPLERLIEWSGKEAEVLKRVRETAFLQLFADVEELKEVQIVDTPGTGSVVDDHEKVATSFLSEEEGKRADALLYVFAPVGRASDEDSLAEFKRTRLPGSDPYNSIGVLHKWDGLEAIDIVAEATKKADRLRSSLSDLVCEVIPVSAPLAMVARHAPDVFFKSLLDYTTDTKSHEALRKALRHDTRWEADSGRRSVRQSYPSFPWVCFVRLVHLLIDRSTDSVVAARAVALEASGIVKLESELDRRFYRRAAIIKQRLTLVKATEPVELGLSHLSARIGEIQTDYRQFKHLASVRSTIPQQQQWLEKKKVKALKEFEDLEAYAVEADRQWLLEKDRMILMEQDLIFLEEMDKNSGFVEARDRETIKELFASATERKDNRPILIEVLRALCNRYGHFINAPNKQTRDHFEHLIRRIQDEIQSRIKPSI
jgi:Dynamin family